MSDWNTYFHNIPIRCKDKLIQIEKNEALLNFLKDPSTNGSILISKYAHKLYEKEIGRPSKISEDSLAIEILGHVYMNKFAGIAATLKIKALTNFLKDIDDRTKIIDCGELDIDSNRHIWDSLEKNKTLVYMACGRNA